LTVGCRGNEISFTPVKTNCDVLMLLQGLRSAAGRLMSKDLVISTVDETYLFSVKLTE